jgi:hypothetical protein
LENRPHYKILNKIIAGVSIVGIVALFLPWTQNISGSGSVTTLKPDQRPQLFKVSFLKTRKMVCSEGDFVKKEIPSCLYPRKRGIYGSKLSTKYKESMDAKKQSQQSYGSK